MCYMREINSYNCFHKKIESVHLSSEFIFSLFVIDLRIFLLGDEGVKNRNFLTHLMFKTHWLRILKLFLDCNLIKSEL